MESERGRTYPKYFLKEFIQLYQRLPSIWNTNCREYRCFEQKTEDYELLIQKWREVEPNADRSFVVKKINCLRTGYRRDCKRAKLGYEPRNWAYKYLTFLSDARNTTETEGTEHTISNEADWEDDNDEEDYEEEAKHCQKQDPLEESSFKLAKEIVRPPTRAKQLTISRVKSAPQSPVIEISDCGQSTGNSSSQNDIILTKLSELLEKNQNQMDRFDHISKTWSYTLRTLPDEQRVIAEKLISDILYSAQMGSLNSKTPLEISQFLYKIQ